MDKKTGENKQKRVIIVLILVAAFFLRFFQLGENPPSLYWDEASLGYNAYTIATSGIDEHGERFPLARFIAFGDYKPPGYIYLTALAIKIFDLSEWSIRFPSALAGLLMVFITYKLVLLLFKDSKIALISSFMLAASSWSLQLSRTAFEANVGAFFNLTAIYFFLLSIKKNRWYFILSVVFFILSFYTFNANRIIAPLILISFCILWFSKIKNYFLVIMLGGILATISLFPSLTYLASRESRLRFQEVSIFTSLNTIKIANERISREGGSFLNHMFHNRRVLFMQDFLSHYFDHFNGRYLFISGDRNPRLSIQYVGELYLFELFLIIPGFYFLWTKNRQSIFVFVIWLFIAIIPAAMARETPHALRTASLLPLPQIFSGAGLIFWLGWLKSKIQPIFPLLGIFLLIFIGSIYYYLHEYYIHAPTRWAGEWQYGYKGLVQTVKQYQDQYPSVVVTRRLGRPYIYFLLYNRFSPQQFVASRKGERDWWGLWEVYGYDKYYFDVGFQYKVPKPILFVGTPDEMPNEAKIIKKIQSPTGEDIFVVSEL